MLKAIDEGMFNGREITEKEAIRWVEDNAKIILGHIRKYLPFAPYDQEDYFQDAYEAALTAAQVSRDRQIPFIACFWIIFKRRITEVTPHPESKHHGGSQSPPKTICDPETEAHERFWSNAEIQEDVGERIDLDSLYLAIRGYLSKVEQRALSMALGIDGKPLGIKEISRNLGCSPANVRQSLNRAYKRLARLVAERKLNIRSGTFRPKIKAFSAPTSTQTGKKGGFYDCRIA